MVGMSCLLYLDGLDGHLLILLLRWRLVLLLLWWGRLVLLLLRWLLLLLRRWWRRWSLILLIALWRYARCHFLLILLS